MDRMLKCWHQDPFVHTAVEELVSDLWSVLKNLENSLSAVLAGSVLGYFLRKGQEKELRKKPGC